MTTTETTFEIIEAVKLEVQSMSADERRHFYDSLRSEYREISAYTIHYSNMRSALFVFLMGAAFYVLAHQYTDDNKSLPIYCSGLLIALFSNWFNIELTWLMQHGLRRLSDIENILSLHTAAATRTDGESDAIKNARKNKL